MRTVRTKKELKQAIKDGEKHIYVANDKLYRACKVASKFSGEKPVKEPGAGLLIELSALELIVIGATIIAVYAIFKGRKVKIKGKKGNQGGEIEVD